MAFASRRARPWLIIGTLGLVMAFGVALRAENAQPVAGPPPLESAPRYRKLAPGVEKVIPPNAAPDELVSRHDLVEILTTDPTYGERKGTEGKSPAKSVRFDHQPQVLQFTFKPVRFIRVDVPNMRGKMVSKLVWYLVYHVTLPKEAAQSFEFMPVFWLENHETHQVYRDKLIPVAIPAIRRREDPNRPLLDSVQIAGEIAPGQDVWGVVTWDDIDPSMDRFSIFVQGLSTAYQWIEEPGVYKAGDPPGTGRKLLKKTLQLNFWRPGDAFHEHESEIRFGMPGEVDYQWIYR